MFFGKSKSSQGDSTREPPFYEVPWIRTLISFCTVLLVIAALIEGYRKAEQYAGRVVKKEFSETAAGKEKITLTMELMNKPAWLDKAILDQLFAETQTFAARDQATYDRLVNPLDHDVLKEVAANYVGTDADGVNHWTLRENAWIKKVNEVKRVISADRKSETIEVYAEYRQPAAWAAYGDKFYLIDNEYVRLPGEYSSADRNATPELMAISGEQLPTGMTKVPEAGETWGGEDMAAGLKMVEALEEQSFSRQIASVDVANFRGRENKLQPWILLETVFKAGSGMPSVVQWGRPVGEESFYDVKAAEKVAALNAIYLRFNRIDAGRDYVDIHTEQVMLPKPVETVASGGATPQG